MDVLLESLPPGFLSSQKLDFSELQRYNPALIMASISPYGRFLTFSPTARFQSLLWQQPGVRSI
jgi:crotonobetainyl-CoA:carnitine CoA-transferase CaiB-like acyl-CoA transferase